MSAFQIKYSQVLGRQSTNTLLDILVKNGLSKYVKYSHICEIRLDSFQLKNEC